MSKKIQYTAALFFMLLLPFRGLEAHPHMFIDMKLKAVFSKEGFKGIWVDWLFDMVFTASVLMDNGLKGTDSFSEEETAEIKNTAFKNLENYHYFAYFNAGGQITRPERFDGFTVYLSSQRLGYRFFLPYDGACAHADEIRIAVYDESFFCDISFTEEAPVKIEAQEELEISWELSQKSDSPIEYNALDQGVSPRGSIYTGQTFPLELVLFIKN